MGGRGNVCGAESSLIVFLKKKKKERNKKEGRKKELDTLCNWKDFKVLSSINLWKERRELKLCSTPALWGPGLCPWIHLEFPSESKHTSKALAEASFWPEGGQLMWKSGLVTWPSGASQALGNSTESSGPSRKFLSWVTLHSTGKRSCFF